MQSLRCPKVEDSRFGGGIKAPRSNGGVECLLPLIQRSAFERRVGLEWVGKSRSRISEAVACRNVN
jgi:hypothetical protein